LIDLVAACWTCSTDGNVLAPPLDGPDAPTAEDVLVPDGDNPDKILKLNNEHNPFQPILDADNCDAAAAEDATDTFVGPDKVVLAVLLLAAVTFLSFASPLISPSFFPSSSSSNDHFFPESLFSSSHPLSSSIDAFLVESVVGVGVSSSPSFIGTLSSHQQKYRHSLLPIKTIF
jgi:hypothetical protein